MKNLTALQAFLASIDNTVAIYWAIKEAVATGINQYLTNRKGENCLRVCYDRRGYKSSVRFFVGDNVEVTNIVKSALQGTY